MQPEEAVPVIATIEGVKSVKTRGRANDTERLQIRYERERIQLAGMAFELTPRFENNRLNQVWLTSGEHCGEDALSSFSELSQGLLAKYPERIVEPQDMRPSDVSRANLRSLQTGEAETLSYGFANSSVVVLLTYALKTDAPPPYPVGGGSFAANLWKLAQTAYQQRRTECHGTGHQRMSIGLQYVARSDFDAGMQQLMKDEQAQQRELSDRL